MSGTVLQTAVGGGTLLGLGALEGVLLAVKSEGAGALNVERRVMTALGTGQHNGLEDAARAIAVAVASETLATVDAQILRAVGNGSVPNIEDFAAAVKAVLTS